MKSLTIAEFEAIKVRLIETCDEPVAELELPADLLDFDVTAMPATDLAQGSASAPSPAPAPAGLSRRSVKISLRVPERTLTAFKTQAAKKRIPYQRLVNQVLRAAAAGWASV